MADEIIVDNVTTSSGPVPFNTTHWIVQALEKFGWTYSIDIHNDGKPRDRIRISFKAKNIPLIAITIICHEDDWRVAMYAYDIIKLPASQPDEQCKLIAAIQREYIFARWMFDESDKTLQAEWFAHIPHSLEGGQMIAEGVRRFVRLVDDAYPFILKQCNEMNLFK